MYSVKEDCKTEIQSDWKPVRLVIINLLRDDFENAENYFQTQ